jgi:hypothetical protein
MKEIAHILALAHRTVRFHKKPDYGRVGFDCELGTGQVRDEEGMISVA